MGVSEVGPRVAHGNSSPILLVNDREADLLALEAALGPLGLPLRKAP